jgi:hypothetical protein
VAYGVGVNAFVFGVQVGFVKIRRGFRVTLRFLPRFPLFRFGVRLE